MAERVQGGRLAARAIAAHGVDTIFTLSGGHVMPIYEGCRLEGVRVVDVRHEQAAAHAAEAWGRMRRACGVAVATAGPGVTGTITAVANSFVAQTPLVLIGGARPLAQAEQRALQELDQLSLLRPITKWAALCTDAERIPELTAAAFRAALAQPRGPVYLELPMDVLFADAPAAEIAPSRSGARAFGDPRELMKAAELLGAAERPVVVAGSGIWWDGAWKQLAAFAENGRNRAPDAGIVGDCAAVLGILADAVKRGGAGDREAWLGRLREAETVWWDEHRAQIDSDAAPIHHYRLGAELDRVLDPGTVVIGDGGDVVAAVSRVLRVHRPGHWLDPGPFGCLGIGPPY